MNISPAAALLAEAIAIAEGYPNPKALPWRARNPGDLELGDFGNGVLNLKTIFPSHALGWTRLEAQAAAMLSAASKHYNPAMTFLQVAATYTGFDNTQPWALAVANHCQLHPTDTLQALLDR